MPPPRIARTVLKSAPKVREGMSADHLAMVRQLECINCPRGFSAPVQAHHLLRTGDHTQRGTGRKPADKFAIPLCLRCHNAVHAHGNDEVYLAGLGIDGRALASSLWAKRGDLEAMERIVFNFKQRARTA
jgi:hypothetical protein